MLEGGGFEKRDEGHAGILIAVIEVFMEKISAHVLGGFLHQVNDGPETRSSVSSCVTVDRFQVPSSGGKNAGEFNKGYRE